MTTAELRALLEAGDFESASWFTALKSVAAEGLIGDRANARDILIRLLEMPPPTGPEAALLNSLLREHGLFPYMRVEGVTDVADRIAYEYHADNDWFDGRPWVYHAEQFKVFQHLAAGENVVLSAPTSFGKSALIDAVIRERAPANVVVIVPTLALMDETRRRVARRFGADYKIITHGSMEPIERNIWVMTQERFLEANPRQKPDLFVIDEFYKLGDADSESRSSLLNAVLLKLLESGAQFYMLGPGIDEISQLASIGLNATFISSHFSTVAVDIVLRPAAAGDERAALEKALSDFPEPSIVYCRSPQRTKEVASWLIEAAEPFGVHEASAEAASWVAKNYHPDWIVSRALQQGIGIHSAKLPRALAMQILRLFNRGSLKTLLATSTLIEGVNSVAKNVVVLDNKQGNKKYDYFTYANIRGRAGRMSEHFVGRVIVLAKPPEYVPVSLDIPALTQSEAASESLLLQIPESQLTPASRARVADLLEQDLVAASVLRANRAVPPRAQIDLAKQIKAAPVTWSRAMNWAGAFPTSEQINQIAEGMFQLAGHSSDSVRSAKQLAYRIKSLRHFDGDMSAMVADQVAQGTIPDKAVEDYLDFTRTWAQFHIPNTLAAVGRLASSVLPSTSIIANPGVFSGSITNLFLPPHVASLEEYGLPIPTTLKLVSSHRLEVAGTFDEVLGRLSSIDLAIGELDDFETELVGDVQESLSPRAAKRRAKFRMRKIADRPRGAD